MQSARVQFTLYSTCIQGGGDRQSVLFLSVNPDIREVSDLGLAMLAKHRW